MTEPDQSRPVPCSEECGWCGENMPTTQPSEPDPADSHDCYDDSDYQSPGLGPQPSEPDHTNRSQECVAKREAKRHTPQAPSW